MVRGYEKNDIDSIIRLLNLHNELSLTEEKEKRKELEDGGKVFVYEDEEGVKGICSLIFWTNSEIGSSAEIILSVEDGPEFKEIANSLWENARIAFKSKEVVFLITHYNMCQERWRDFYTEKQFESWFGIHGMIYRGGSFEETKLTFRNYEEDDFNTYYTYLGECFSSMREANDIRPFNIYKSSSQERIEKLRQSALEAKDTIYLFYDGDKLVGSSIIKPGDIDDVFVVPEFQGMGYGRKIMEATLNLALGRNYDRITLGVVAWNTKAINLYKSLGFEVYQSFEHRRLFLKE